MAIRCTVARGILEQEVSGFSGLSAYVSIFKAVREASIPKTRAAEETHAYSLEEVFGMMAAVPEPASTMLCAVAFTGARRGELRGMQWRDYYDGELAISRSVWNGIATDPKTEKSKAPIPIVKLLATK